MKHRAWNVFENEWEDGQVATVYLGLDGEAMAFDGKHVWGDIGDALELNEMSVFKDLSGGDIHVNDIVTYEDDEGSLLGIVKKGVFSWYLELVQVNDIILFESFCDENDLTAHCRVIGNTYEHKHLLEVTV